MKCTPLELAVQACPVSPCPGCSYCGSCPYAPVGTKMDFAAEAGKMCELKPANMILLSVVLKPYGVMCGSSAHTTCSGPWAWGLSSTTAWAYSAPCMHAFCPRRLHHCGDRQVQLVRPSPLPAGRLLQKVRGYGYEFCFPVWPPVRHHAEAC